MLCNRYYSEIETLSCEIRKTTAAGGETARMLSRVFYRIPNHIHVDNVSPIKRRIVADGQNLYYYQTGCSKGFSKPIATLEGEMLAKLKEVPGTAMEHLLRMKDIPETVLAPSDGFPVRRGYKTATVFAVLALDELGRPARISFFRSDSMQELVAQYDYSDFYRVSDTCWIPCTHSGFAYNNTGDKITETRHITNLEVNKPIADSLFIASDFFDNIQFVDDLEATFR